MKKEKDRKKQKWIEKLLLLLIFVGALVASTEAISRQDAIDIFVPYENATQNVNLSNYNLTTKCIMDADSDSRLCFENEVLVTIT